MSTIESYHDLDWQMGDVLRHKRTGALYIVAAGNGLAVKPQFMQGKGPLHSLRGLTRLLDNIPTAQAVDNIELARRWERQVTTCA